MTIVYIILAALALAMVAFVFYRRSVVEKQSEEVAEQSVSRVSPLAEKIKKGEAITAKDVLPYAENIVTRYDTFRLLSNHDKAHLFPLEYFTLVRSAESLLVNWLEFPTELGAIPDDIAHIKRVSIDFDGNNNFVHYEVFKYRVNPPHWAAEDGWILGVVGPYFDDSRPYDFPKSTFSRVSSTVDKVTPEEEVKWVHENISLRE